VQRLALLILIDEVNAHFKNNDYSLYAMVRKDINESIGIIWLLIADFELHFTPATKEVEKISNEQGEMESKIGYFGVNLVIP